MGSTTIFFQGNLKFLRERQKLTQEELAEKLSLTRVRLNALESGHTKSPSQQDYIDISNFFRISIDSLLRVDLSKLGELNLRKLESGDDVYLRGGKLRVLAITVDGNNRENVEIVPIKAKAGYLAGYNDPDYIASLPKTHLPFLPEKATYRIFTIEGNSMLPIAAGSQIIASYVQDWKRLKAGTPCIVVSSQHGLAFKLVSLQADGNLLLCSLNSEFEPYRLPVGEVDELWAYHSHISFQMPQVESLAFITKTLVELRDHLIK